MLRRARRDHDGRRAADDQREEAAVGRLDQPAVVERAGDARGALERLEFEPERGRERMRVGILGDDAAATSTRSAPTPTSIARRSAAATAAGGSRSRMQSSSAKASRGGTARSGAGAPSRFAVGSRPAPAPARSRTGRAPPPWAMSLNSERNPATRGAGH
jgi:hypothetical protein